ncbi:MAG: endoflagellar protein [Cellulosilyticum sp.]|nr:endoflagellar protein [Cellulosilyticum sp.]
MVMLTKLNNQIFTVNCDLIETLEQTPDTVIVMTTGNKYVVKETPEEILKKIIDFKRKINTIENREG